MPIEPNPPGPEVRESEGVPTRRWSSYCPTAAGEASREMKTRMNCKLTQPKATTPELTEEKGLASNYKYFPGWFILGWDTGVEGR